MTASPYSSPSLRGAHALRGRSARAHRGEYRQAAAQRRRGVPRLDRGHRQRHPARVAGDVHLQRRRDRPAVLRGAGPGRAAWGRGAAALRLRRLPRDAGHLLPADARLRGSRRRLPQVSFLAPAPLVAHPPQSPQDPGLRRDARLHGRDQHLERVGQPGRGGRRLARRGRGRRGAGRGADRGDVPAHLEPARAQADAPRSRSPGRSEGGGRRRAGGRLQLRAARSLRHPAGRAARHPREPATNPAGEPLLRPRSGRPARAAERGPARRRRAASGSRWPATRACSTSPPAPCSRSSSRRRRGSFAARSSPTPRR